MEHKVNEPQDTEVITIKLEDNQCQHEFYKAGAWIKCKKCTVAHFDPDNQFPIKKWNNKFKKTY